MKERHLDEDEYLEEVYGDSEADRLDEHLEEIAWNDPAGGFTADEIDFLTSDESRFAWLLASDMRTIRAWLDTGKDTYTQAHLPDPEPAPAQHTPGPWIVYTGHDNQDAEHPYILQDDAQRPSKVIAIMFDDDPHTRPYNAALVSSAPDLLAALQACLTDLEDLTPHYQTRDTIRAAYAAIQKAKGE